jgi:hypothetical protein
LLFFSVSTLTKAGAFNFATYHQTEILPWDGSRARPPPKGISAARNWLLRRTRSFFLSFHTLTKAGAFNFATYHQMYTRSSILQRLGTDKTIHCLVVLVFVWLEVRADIFFLCRNVHLSLGMCANEQVFLSMLTTLHCSLATLSTFI